MHGVGDQGLAVEDVAADALGDGHAEVYVEADAGYADAGVFFVGAEEVGGVVSVVVVGQGREACVGVGAMVMAFVVVIVAAVGAGLGAWHGCWCG